MKESHKIPRGPSLVWKTVLALPSEQGEMWGLRALQNNSTHIPHGLVQGTAVIRREEKGNETFQSEGKVQKGH